MRVAFNSPARNHIGVSPAQRSHALCRLVGESFNGRTAGLQPANEGSIPSSSTKVRRGYKRSHECERGTQECEMSLSFRLAMASQTFCSTYVLAAKRHEESRIARMRRQT